jgi:hypothetical protein
VEKRRNRGLQVADSGRVLELAFVFMGLGCGKNRLRMPTKVDLTGYESGFVRTVVYVYRSRSS